MLEISVVIATWNRRDLLARTLPTLLNQQLPADQYEIIVVVDGSTDGTAEFLRGIQTDRTLRIIEQENRGQAAAINAGIKAASGRLVLFLDDDILCSPNLLAEHVAVQRSGNACLVFGPVLLAPGAPDPLAADWADIFCGNFFRDLRPEDAGRGWHDCMASANSSGSRDVLLSVGGLDESFGRGNDYDFGIRLLRAGLYICLSAKRCCPPDIHENSRRCSEGHRRRGHQRVASLADAP